MLRNRATFYAQTCGNVVVHTLVHWCSFCTPKSETKQSIIHMNLTSEYQHSGLPKCLAPSTWSSMAEEGAVLRGVQSIWKTQISRLLISRKPCSKQQSKLFPLPFWRELRGLRQSQAVWVTSTYLAICLRCTEKAQLLEMCVPTQWDHAGMLTSVSLRASPLSLAAQTVSSAILPCCDHF